MAAAPRRRKIIGHRRRVEDEGEDDAAEQLELDDDSLTDGSIASDENDPADNSDTSNIDETSPTSPRQKKTAGNGAAKAGPGKQPEPLALGSTSAMTAQAAVSDTDIMLNGLPIGDSAGPVKEINYEDTLESPSKTAAPIVVSSSSAPQPQKRESVYERQRREHDLYRQKRDEDPAFVPNRGAFFMHDHRGAGPSANGFRPFARGARGRGRGGMGGPFAAMHQLHNPSDPTTNSQWSHDMHDAVGDPNPHPHPPRQPLRHMPDQEGPPNGDGHIPTRPQNPEPINRTMSYDRPLGNVTIRAFFPPLKNPVTLGQIKWVQYTKLPDHRPPLRRDKPVRISLPDHPPRYVFPAMDRSFIFIPRAQRPNQQRPRGGRRSGLGSVSGFSRRTSVFGGSYYNGSVYSPSIAQSRRSSIAHDMGVISPTGSTMSRPQLPVDHSRPVVRLPPPARSEQVMPPPVPVGDASASGFAGRMSAGAESSINDLPQPQTHPLPQKPTFQENRPNAIPMHQPRPQKAVSVESIESPTTMMPFHQQMPVQVSNGFPQDAHHRNPSYPSHTTGTPLSQIPERAIHAAPFQPNSYPPQGFYGQPSYQVMPPQQGYFYPPSYGGNMGPSATAPSFVPGAQQAPPPSFNQPNQPEASGGQPGGQTASGQNLVAQEVNGMVYYYDASQLPAVTGYPSYPGGQQGFVPAVPVAMGGMVTPSPDGFFYPQPAPGMVYYPQ